jgi:hypothetical protein
VCVKVWVVPPDQLVTLGSQRPGAERVGFEPTVRFSTSETFVLARVVRARCSILRHLFIVLVEHLIQRLGLGHLFDGLSDSGVLAGILVSRSSGGSSSRISRQQTLNT